MYTNRNNANPADETRSSLYLRASVVDLSSPLPKSTFPSQVLDFTYFTPNFPPFSVPLYSNRSDVRPVAGILALGHSLVFGIWFLVIRARRNYFSCGAAARPLGGQLTPPLISRGLQRFPALPKIFLNQSCCVWEFIRSVLSVVALCELCVTPLNPVNLVNPVQQRHHSPPRRARRLDTAPPRPHCRLLAGEPTSPPQNQGGQTAESSAVVCGRPIEPAPGNAGEGTKSYFPPFPEPFPNTL
jgi:hypothetical protein